MLKSFVTLGAIVTLLTGCVGRFELTHKIPCSSLIPAENKKRTPGAKLPVEGELDPWFAFGEAQTGQLDEANSREETNRLIVEQCELHDRSAMIKPKGKFIGVFIKKK